MTFCERLKYARKKMCMTQGDLAKHTGLDGAQICKYEKGGDFPSLENFRKICIALCVSADYLLDINLSKLWGME
jgi:transcriptional regulator with XRE-family HTH domain